MAGRKLLLSCGDLVPSLSVEEFGDGAHEVGGGGLGRDAAMEDGLIRDVGAIVGSGVVHVLVDHVAREVSATSAYVVSEMFGWGGGIDKKLWRARRFYATLIAVLVVGSGIALAGVPPIKLLFFSPIAGGLATPIALTMMMLIAGNRTAMRRKPLNPFLLGSGWVVTFVVTSAATIFLSQTLTGKN